MKIERPISVNVIGWLFIVGGGLSALSAFGYILVALNTNLNDPQFMLAITQVVIAISLAYCGFIFKRGSNSMRQILEYSSYILACIFLYWGYSGYAEFNSYGAIFAVIVTYLIPLAFVIKALRSDKVKLFSQQFETKKLICGS